MIAVIGSAHDPVARALVEAWPRAALCSAEDLTSEGWVWPLRGEAAGRTWVLGGARIPDEQVNGVFVRRATVYPEELLAIHPEDRGYVAAEAHAFLIYVLATTQATVVNPVGDGGLGEEVLRPERWMSLAGSAGLRIAPLRLSSTPRPRRPLKLSVVEVVGDEAFGEAPRPRRVAAAALAKTLDLRWGAFLFDGHGRLVTITGRSTPGEEAAQALARMLGRPGA